MAPGWAQRTPSGSTARCADSTGCTVSSCCRARTPRCARRSRCAMSSSSRRAWSTAACTRRWPSRWPRSRPRSAVAERGETAMGLSNMHELPAPDHRGGGARARHAHTSRPHHVGMGRALQRRRRSHVRGHAHDDRGAPGVRRAPARAAGRTARELSQRAQRRRQLRGQRLSPKPVFGSAAGSGALGRAASLIGTAVRAAAAAARALVA